MVATNGLRGVMPWYCSAPSFLSDRLESCIPNAAQQVEIMRGNFGASADPNLVAQATGNFANYLDWSGYDETIATKKQDDTNSSWMPILLVVGVVGLGLTVLGDSGPRRYGR